MNQFTKGDILHLLAAAVALPVYLFGAGHVPVDAINYAGAVCIALGASIVRGAK